MELIKQLSGHSGCRLTLYQEQDRIFLRKDAGTVSYNKRLKRQYLKQRFFSMSGIKTPSIFKRGYNEAGVFFFDMEYINGIALAEYMKSIKIKEIVDLVNLLFRSLSINQGIYFPKANIIFTQKINALSEKLDMHTPVVCEAVKLLKNFDFSHIPHSKCLGDLTLENILISPNGVYVIDLLDSFYDSWLIDIAKLLQDLEIGWSYRGQARDFALNLRLSTAREALFDNLKALPGANYIPAIYHILLLNLLRIYPYATSTATVSFLNQATSSTISRIKQLEKNI